MVGYTVPHYQALTPACGSEPIPIRIHHIRVDDMRRPWFLVPGVLVMIVAVLTACAPVSHTTAKAVPTTPQEVSAGKVALQVLNQLKANGMPIATATSFTPSTDPVHLLGRPGQYIGKVAFHDARVPSDAQPNTLDVVDGGSIEIFQNIQTAQAAEDYINQMSQAGALFFTEYDYFNGIVLLRLSSQLTPDEAHIYKNVFYSLPKMSTLPAS
jgi:hypothetical protein